jgi:hypothetical protein
MSRCPKYGLLISLLAAAAKSRPFRIGPPVPTSRLFAATTKKPNDAM